MRHRSQAQAIDVPVHPVLSRNEMAFCGVPDKEMAHLRAHARRQFPRAFWMIEDEVDRQRTMFELLKAYAEALPEARRGALLVGLEAARKNWEKILRRLQSKQARRLARRPNTRDLGAVPSKEDLPTDLPRREAKASRSQDERDMIRRAHQGDRPTQGEERWDPKWGDPEAPLPPVMPQGMKRLPQSDPVEVPPNPRRAEGGRPAQKPGRAKRSSGQTSEQ